MKFCSECKSEFEPVKAHQLTCSRECGRKRRCRLMADGRRKTQEYNRRGLKVSLRKCDKCGKRRQVGRTGICQSCRERICDSMPGPEYMYFC